jgi:TRAP transporter TAXI family solute receptor
MKMQRITAGMVLLITLTAGIAYSHTDGIAIGMVTGSKTGTYIQFGREIAAVASKDGLTINVFDSSGSVDNIKRITSKEKVGLAIVQSDVLGFLSHSKTATSVNTDRKLRLVAPLYNEEVHILARNGIKTLSDLNGKRVIVGSEGSGSLITSVNIFSIMGITPSRMYQIDPPKGVVSVLDNDIDAVVFVGGKPVKMFKNMEELASITKGPNAGKLSQVHFIPIDDPRLLKEYKQAKLTHDDYNYITTDVPTIAVTALLITYDYTLKKDSYYHVQCHNMAVLGKALRDHLSELKASGHPKWKEVDLNANVGDWKRDTCSSEGEQEEKPVQEHVEKAPEGSLEKDLLGVVRGKQ